MYWSSSQDWDTGTFSQTVLSGNTVVLAAGQTSGTWTSAVIDFGETVLSWTLVPGFTGLQSGFTYQTRSSADGTTWTAYAPGLIEPPQQYGQIQITITSATTAITSLTWNAVVEAAGPKPNVFRRILQDNFKLGIDTGPGASPALRIVPPSGADTSISVSNDELLVFGNSPQVGLSFDLTTVTLGQLASLLTANLPGYSIQLLAPPPFWPSNSLAAVSGTVLTPTPPQLLTTNPVVSLWTSTLWRILRPVGIQLASLVAQAGSPFLQLSILQAQGYWLDRWGDYLGYPRYAGEPDNAYRNRLIALRFRPRTAVGLEQLTGWTVTTTAPAAYTVAIPYPIVPPSGFTYTQDQSRDIVSAQNTTGWNVTLNWELQPSLEQVTVSDLTTASSIISKASQSGYSGAVVFGSAAQWQGATLSNVDATTRPGSVILASGQTTGTATTGVLDLGPMATYDAANSLTFTWSAYTDASTSVAVQVKFSENGSYQAVTSGVPISPVPGRYPQVQITLTGTTSDTPQFNNFRMFVQTQAQWSYAVWHSKPQAGISTLPLTGAQINAWVG